MILTIAALISLAFVACDRDAPTQPVVRAGKATDDDCAFCDLFGAFNEAQEEEDETPTEEAETDSTSSEGGPDLIVQSPSASAVVLTPGQAFTLQVTVQNQGDEQAAATMLHYYRSNNATITASDTEVGTGAVDALDASATSTQSIELTASVGVERYYGACVASVDGESNTDNNCSPAVKITVSGQEMSEDEGEDAQDDHTPDFGEPFTTTETEAPESEPTITAGESKRLTKLYLVSLVGVHQANPDGSSVRTLVYDVERRGGVLANWDLGLDTDRGKMYWLDERRDMIGSANLDGSQVQEILTRKDGLRRPECLAVGAGKIYWGSLGPLVKSDGETEWGLYKANIDGSGIETIVDRKDAGRVMAIALDVRAGKVYWVSYQPNAIQRANLDGSDVELLVSNGVGTPGYAPSGFAIDTQHGYMYWSQSYPNPGMYRANMDGVVEPVLSWEITRPWWEDGPPYWWALHGNLRRPRGIAVDSMAGKMYWIASADHEYGETVLVQNNLDGSHVETFAIDGDPILRNEDWLLKIVPLFE